jgi:hypothetical protein
MQKVVVTSDANWSSINKYLDDGWYVKDFKVAMSAESVGGGGQSLSTNTGTVQSRYVFLLGKED